MSKSNSLENSLLLLLFNGTAITGLAENDSGTTVLTTLYVSLHTADPAEGGNQTSNETSYTAYARVAVARTAGGWTITGNSVSPAAEIAFPECAGGTATITHGAIGTASSGAGVLLYKGTVTPNISVLTGVTPKFTTLSAVTED